MPKLAPPPSGVLAQSQTSLFTCVVGLLLLITLLLPAAAFAQTDPAHQQFLFAYKLLQRGENQLAVEAFDEYLQNYPEAAKRGDAQYFAAMLYRKLGQPQQALERLQNPVDPTLVQPMAVRLLRGQLLVDAGRYAPALSVLENINVAQQPPDIAVSVWYLRGIAYRGTGNLAAAVRALEQAAAIDSPMRRQARLDLARTQIRADQPDAALATLDTLLQTDDAAVTPQAARLAGDLNYQLQRYDQAAQAYARVTSRYQASSQFAPCAMGMLWAYHKADNPQAVVNAYRRFAEALPRANQPTAAYLAAVSLQKLGRHEDAVELLQPLAGRFPESDVADQLLYRLAVSQFELQQYAAMQQTVMQLLAAHPNTPVRPDATFLLASADAKQGNAARGVTRLTEIVEQGPSHPYFLNALLQRARLYEENDQPRAAATDYNRYLENCEYERLSEPVDGRTMFKPDATQVKILLRLLDLAYRTGQYEQVEQVAAQWFLIMKLPADVEQEVLYRVALAQIRQGKRQQAIQTLTDLNRQHPVHRYEDEADYYLGLLRTTEGQGQQATTFLTEAAQSDRLPAELRINALRLLFLNYKDAGEAPRAAAALRDIEKLAGIRTMTTDDLLWLAAFFNEQGQPQQALTYAKAALQPQRKADLAAQTTAWLQQGRALFQLEQWQPAMQAFDEAIKAGRGPVAQAELYKGQALLAADQPQQAYDTLTPLVQSEQPAVAAPALLARGQAMLEIANAARRSGDDAKAQSALRNARAAFKRLVLLYPSDKLSPTPQRGYVLLAIVEQQAGRSDEARLTLEELAQGFADSPYATFAKAMQANLAGQSNRTTALREQLLQQNPDPWLTEQIRRQLP